MEIQDDINFPNITYEIAICKEKLGLTDEAQELYKSALNHFLPWFEETPVNARLPYLLTTSFLDSCTSRQIMTFKRQENIGKKELQSKLFHA